ncbi:hypothetical protein HYH03_002669 [Edaphochlamys debaryana]|uniref:Uncharacterized protein n=1 Tax=Edaphochlamys debaryana TaxID=47281 RepID=A0A836C433_9CHLO|nr:hypothetical protein HYH03_002669 [Edaphochlamys debaryana]|eukprot:KAG2499736.1 hypothetical protein HYH03_002669 [Edaphochlamys debaryana]
MGAEGAAPGRYVGGAKAGGPHTPPDAATATVASTSAVGEADRGGGGGAGGGGKRPSSRERSATDPRRVMTRIKEAASLRELQAAVLAPSPSPSAPSTSSSASLAAPLASNPLLLVAAAARLARLATAPAPASSTAPPKGVPPGRERAKGRDRGGDVGKGNATADTEAEAAAVLCVLGALLPAARSAVPRMRPSELASLAWALGKLAPQWTGGPQAAAAQATAAAIAARLQNDLDASEAPGGPPAPGSQSPEPARALPSPNNSADAASGGRRGASEGGQGTGGSMWEAASTQDVANLAWGLARTGVVPARGRARGADGGKGGSAEAAWRWLAAAAADVVWRGEAKDVSSLAFAFASAGWPDEHMYGNLMTALLSPRRGPAIISSLREEEATSLVWALGTAVGSRRRNGLGSEGGNEEGGEGADEASPQAAPGPLAEEQRLGLVTQRLAERVGDLATSGRLTGRQVSSLLWSLAVLQGHTGADLDPTAIQALCRRAASTAGYMDGRSLGTAAWALGTLRLRQPAALEALCTAAAARLAGAGARARPEAAAGASALAGPGVPGSAPGGGMSVRDLVQLLWGCARAGHEPSSELLEAAVGRLLTAAPSLDAWSVASLATAAAAWGADAAAAGRQQALLSALCARARALMPPPPGAATNAPANALTPSQLAALLAALGRAQHADTELAEAAAGVLSGRLAELGPKEVCAAVSGLGRLEQPHAPLLAAVEAAVLADSRPYGPGELAALMYGIAEAGGRADRLFARAAAVLSASRHRKRRFGEGGGGGAGGGGGVAALTPEELTRVAEAVAVAGGPDDELFEALAAEVLQRGGAFSAGQLERLALAFRSLGYADADELLRAGAGQGTEEGRGGGEGRWEGEARPRSRGSWSGVGSIGRH